MKYTRNEGRSAGLYTVVLGPSGRQDYARTRSLTSTTIYDLANSIRVPQ